VIFYGDLLLQATALGFFLCVALWVIGLIQTWWGKLRLMYFGVLGAFGLGLLPVILLGLPRNAFGNGKSDWFEITLVAASGVVVAIGMLFLSALAHGIFLMRSASKI
jgi:hypothetical protein